MKTLLTKPTFKEIVAVTTMELPDSKLTFNAQRIGPMNFNGLRKSAYGNGFQMPTMSELTELVDTSLENQDYKTAKEVISTLRNYWLTGNIAVHYFPEGMFVEDNPEMKNGRIVSPDFKTLKNKLGEHKENGVVFSDDKKIRFTPYNYKKESQNDFELSQNTGVIALLGGEEKAEKIARASGHYKINPYFWALSNVNSPQTRVAGLNSSGFDDRLDVNADYSEDFIGRCSFGVRETK